MALMGQGSEIQEDGLPVYGLSLAKQAHRGQIEAGVYNSVIKKW